MDVSDIDLPTLYDALSVTNKKIVRDRYVVEQNGKCMHCGKALSFKPPASVRRKKINWDKFPKGFLRYPIHLQHNHTTGLTEGAVHAYCNAVLWQYHGR